MKTVWTCLIIFATQSAFAQGTFQNLDFESANPQSAGNPNFDYFVTVASALPGWSVYYSGIQQTEMSYNGISAGATQVTLVSAANQQAPALDGNYSVMLQGDVPGSTASISQTGLIPAGTQSLYFEATPFEGPQGSLDLYIGGQDVAYAAVSASANYTLYAADISEWAGQTEALSFSAPSVRYNNWVLDDISFSVNPVPEPNSLLLTGIGGTLWGFWRYVRCKRR